MGERRRARECALQALFQIDLTGGAAAEVLESLWRGRTESDDVRAFAERLVLGVGKERAGLDRWIVGSAKNWRLERMAAVDRNVLRIAVYEMLHEEETPAAVVIDEAIEVARKFGSEASAAFINGVLDAIRERIETESGRSSAEGRRAAT